MPGAKDDESRDAERDRSISINPFRVSRVVSTRELFDALRAVKWLLPYSLALANQPSSDIYTLQRRVALCTEREKGKEREGQKRSSSRSILASISRKKFRKKASPIGESYYRAMNPKERKIREQKVFRKSYVTRRKSSGVYELAYERRPRNARYTRRSSVKRTREPGA